MTEVKIVADKANPLLNRRELECEIAYEGATPSREEVKAAIVKMLGVNPETTVVIEILQNFGSKTSHAVVHVYNSKEDMRIVAPYILSRESKKDKKQDEKKEEQKQQTAQAKQ